MASRNKTPVRWPRRAANALLYVVLAVALVWAIDWYRTRDVPGYVPQPQYQLTDLQGNSFALSDVSQQEPVVVYFWATWCPVCKLTSPVINRLSANYSVVSIALRSGNNDRLRQYMAAQNYQFTVISDPDGHLTSQWHVAATPTIAIVVNNRIVSVNTGITGSWGLRARLWFYRTFY